MPASSFDPKNPYNDLPRLPPHLDIETNAVLKSLVRVRVALEGLREAGRFLPNQTVVLKSMVLQEAKLSSEIENIVTTNDELYKQIDFDASQQSPEVKEIRRYSSALWKGYDRLRSTAKIDTALIVEVASEILEQPLSVRATAGTRIGVRGTEKIVYTPPTGEELIRDLLSNLLQFTVESSELDPLIRIAAAHYQFEAIHPFRDGNGRTGRVLNILFMIRSGLLDLPVLYLSQEILATRSEYYRLLRNVTEKDQWEKWILYFLDCVETTALVTKRQFYLIVKAMEAAREVARSADPKTYSVELIELIFSKPYTRINDVVQAKIAKRETASKYLWSLEKAGLLTAEKAHRETLFFNRRLMDILSFASDLD